MLYLPNPLQIIQDQESLEKLEDTIVVHPTPTHHGSIAIGIQVNNHFSNGLFFGE